ncbi:MAG TPA: hypothetical protein VLB80_05180 [Candidatus Babeliales bacterium]|nr:hypothetical protein [Candidatus Babeliales bacterium]
MKNNLFLCTAMLLIYGAQSFGINDAVKEGQNFQSAITWEPNGGRFGDNLLSYSKAKWLSYRHQIPLLYLPFPHSDELIMHEQENIYTTNYLQLFSHVMHLPQSSHYKLLPNSNTLYISHWKTDVVIDWFDAVFIKELKKNIMPRYPIEKVIIPDGCVSIAVHVRNGGGFVVDNEQEKERCPLRFVPDEFFIAQVERLAKMFENEKLYVHIFTDHLEPAELLTKFKKALKNYQITFGCRMEENNHKLNVLEDFFSMMEFDCLVRPGSHYSRFVQRLGNNKVVIYPESVKKLTNGKSIIDVIAIKKRPNSNTRWKTKKIVIA